MEYNIMTPNEFNTPEGRKWLTDMLKMGPVEITFTKKDGTERVMSCTLKEDLMINIPSESTSEKKRVVSEETLPVYDLEKESWRSFRLDSITQVKFDI